MTRDEAVEKCVKAMLKQRGLPDHSWRQYPVKLNQAQEIVACLEALELFKPAEAVLVHN